jgi:Spy/CpxP family protein refolding chaperone
MLKFRAAAMSAAAVVGLAVFAGAQTPAPKDTAHRGIRGERHGQMDGKHRAGMRGQRGHFGRRAAQGRGEFVKDLNLTDAQKTRIKSIHEKYQPQLKKLREDSRTQFKAIRDARQKGDTSAAARERFRAQREQFQNRVRALREQERNEIRAVLTADQRAKWDAAKAKRENAMKQRHERMQQRRGGKRA